MMRVMADETGRHDLTDRAWAVLEPLLPVAVVGQPNRRTIVSAFTP
jgi:transposase